jgi:hypothetical protein
VVDTPGTIAPPDIWRGVREATLGLGASKLTLLAAQKPHRKSVGLSEEIVLFVDVYGGFLSASLPSHELCNLGQNINDFILDVNMDIVFNCGIMRV